MIINSYLISSKNFLEISNFVDELTYLNLLFQIDIWQNQVNKSKNNYVCVNLAKYGSYSKL